MSIFSTWATIQKIENVINDLTTLAGVIQGTAAWTQLVADIKDVVNSYNMAKGRPTVCAPHACLMAGTGVLAIVSMLFQLYQANASDIDGVLKEIYDLIVKARAASGM